MFFFPSTTLVSLEQVSKNEGYFEEVTGQIDYILVYWDNFVVFYEIFCICVRLLHI